MPTHPRSTRSPGWPARARKAFRCGWHAGKETWPGFMRHHPWLARLLDGADLPDHGRLLVDAPAEIDGVPVRVVELTGSQGDVVITHLHICTPAHPIPA